MPSIVKTPVADAAVDEYVARIRAGGPLGEVFPGKLTQCEFTPTQREKIRKARAEKRALQKNGRSYASPVEHRRDPSLAAVSHLSSTKVLTKLRKILYLQGETCFFCGKPLREEDASIEHLNPKSRGGSSTEDNEVVCHKTLNQAFGDMDLKRKLDFVAREHRMPVAILGVCDTPALPSPPFAV
jgi:5-methylcytosine-specific restriction endonuclease McrA